MFIKKVIFSVIAIGLITAIMSAKAVSANAMSANAMSASANIIGTTNTSDRTIIFNGVLASQYELPVLRRPLLGFTAPDGLYVLDPDNGALYYSTGVTSPVLLGYIPTNRGGSQGTFEDNVGDFCAHNGGCNILNIV